MKRSEMDQTHIEVLHDIHFTNILPQGANTDTMATIAYQILHNDIRAIRFE